MFQFWFHFPVNVWLMLNYFSSGVKYSDVRQDRDFIEKNPNRFRHKLKASFSKFLFGIRLFDADVISSFVEIARATLSLSLFAIRTTVTKCEMRSKSIFTV